MDPTAQKQEQSSSTSEGKRKYKVTFLPDNVTVEVDESQFPFGERLGARSLTTGVSRNGTGSPPRVTIQMSLDGHQELLPI